MSVVYCNFVCFEIELEFGYIIEMLFLFFWLKDGKISFECVLFSYSSEGLWVLKDILFIVNFGEKFGIVGWFGFGKIFIVNVFFWMLECGGKIMVDGVGISNFEF